MNTSLIDFLENPDSYPHDPEQVTHIQTHISHVFMADTYVYKVKKAVSFEFLDFSTLEKRKFYCNREVELNRRLCEGIYLGAVKISSIDGHYQLESDDGGTVVEYAVKMKKLPQQYFLHTFIENGRLSIQHLERVADKLADFYQSQQVNEEILKWGHVEKIRYNTDENFQQTRPFIGETINENSFDAIQQYTNQYFKRYEPLFTQRMKGNRIVDGHGDLHLEHIHITPDKVRIFDCIEFNDRFRYGDVAADLAFLAMDLDFNDCPKEERYFVKEMAQKLSDENLTTHINFYKCYRAYIKGKVKSLQSYDEEVGEEDRKKALQTAKNYFNLSLRYALLGSTPTVLVTMGRPATGKSTLAEQLSKKLNIDCFSSDRIRKKMAGLPLYRRTDRNARENLYAPEMSAKTYRKLEGEAGKKLKQNQSVILDATYSKKEVRDNLIGVLQNIGTNYYFIEACTSDKTIKQRLRERETSQGNVSDARIEDFEKLDRYYESPDEIISSHLIRVDTEKSVENTLEQLYCELIKRHLDSIN